MKKAVAVTVAVVPSLLLLLFGYTAFGKFYLLAAFRAVLRDTSIIGPGAAVPAPAIPLAELCIVLLLLFHRTVQSYCPRQRGRRGVGGGMKGET